MWQALDVMRGFRRYHGLMSFNVEQSAMIKCLYICTLLGMCGTYHSRVYITYSQLHMYILPSMTEHAPTSTDRRRPQIIIILPTINSDYAVCNGNITGANRLVLKLVGHLLPRRVIKRPSRQHKGFAANATI